MFFPIYSQTVAQKNTQLCHPDVIRHAHRCCLGCIKGKVLWLCLMSWTSHTFLCTSSMFRLHPPSLFLFAKRGCRCVLLPLANNVQHYGKVQCNMLIESCCEQYSFVCLLIWNKIKKIKKNSWIGRDCGDAFRLLDFLFIYFFLDQSFTQSFFFLFFSHR